MREFTVHNALKGHDKKIKGKTSLKDWLLSAFLLKSFLWAATDWWQIKVKIIENVLIWCCCTTSLYSIWMNYNNSVLLVIDSPSVWYSLFVALIMVMVMFFWICHQLRICWSCWVCDIHTYLKWNWWKNGCSFRITFVFFHLLTKCVWSRVYCYHAVCLITAVWGRTWNMVTWCIFQPLILSFALRVFPEHLYVCSNCCTNQQQGHIQNWTALPVCYSPGAVCCEYQLTHMRGGKRK